MNSTVQLGKLRLREADRLAPGCPAGKRWSQDSNPAPQTQTRGTIQEIPPCSPKGGG